MKIQDKLYPYLEVSQVLAIDQNFSHRPGLLILLAVGAGRQITVGYMGDLDEENKELNKEERLKLSRIIYGWGPKVHSAPKNDEVPVEKAEVKLGSFSKIKNSQDKSLMHLVPLNVIRAVADVYTAEFPQYGEDWKRLPNAKTVFYNALFRHMEQYQSGARYDDDGKLHSVKMVCNAIFLAWYDLIGGGKGDIEI